MRHPSGKITASASDAIDWLAAYAPATVREYATDIGVAYACARKRIRDLEAHGIATREPRALASGRWSWTLTERGIAVWRVEVLRRWDDSRC